MKILVLKYYLIAILLLLTAVGLQGQNIRFDRIGLQDGLSQSSIQCMLQDSNGLIWLGTEDGLNQYDGYQSRVYSHDALDSNSLSNNIIVNIIEEGEEEGVFWVAALHGINRLDTRLQQVARYYNTGDISDDRNYITAMSRNPWRKSSLWVGTHEGVFSFDTQQKVFEPFQKAIFSKLRILSIHVADNNLLWLGTRQQGVYAWDQARDELAHSFAPKDFGRDEIGVFMVHTFKGGTTWIGTSDGLFEVNSEGVLQEVKGFEGLPVSALHERSDGIWVGTHRGLCRIQGDKKTWYYHEEKAPLSLANDRIASMITDNAGILWIGTYFGGVSKYNPYAHQIPYYGNSTEDALHLESKVVRAVVKDSSDRVWVGTNGGLSCLDRNAKKTYHYGLSSGLNELIVRALHIDKNGTLWVGTGGGNGALHYWNEATKRFTVVGTASGYQNAPSTIDIYAINSSSDGTLWVGTQGEGLYRLPPNQKAFKNYRNKVDNEQSLCNDFINAILEDHYHNMWFATRGGLAYLPTSDQSEFFRNYIKTGNIEGGLPHDYIKSLYEAPDGKLWLGTSGTGLLVMEDSSGVFKQFTQFHGLPNNMVYSVLPDKEGKIWLSTNRGLAQFDRERERVVKLLDIFDGLQGHEYNTGAYHKSDDGELFFGGVNGLNSFYPSKLNLNPISAKPWISSLQILNKPVSIGNTANDLLTKHISFTDTLYLNYKHQVFTLEAIALHQAAPKQNHISYRMRGLSDEWQTMGAQRRFITYTTLPSDTYTFELKAGNSDGIWGEETRKLTIIVSPPLWNTWWFKLLAIALLLFIAIAIYQWRMQDLMQQRKKLEKKVQERTATLEEQKIEINSSKEEILIQNEELRQQQDEILAQRDFIEEKSRLMALANEDLESANQQMVLQKDMIEASLRNLEHLSKIGREITSLLQIENITKTVYEHVNMLMDASGFGIGLYDEQEEHLEFHSFIERGEEVEAFTNELKPDKYLSAHCFAFRKEIIIQQKVARSALKYIKEPLEVKNGGQLPNSIIYLPLLSEGRAIGVITVQSLFEKAYADYELNMLRNIAIYVAIALDNANAYDIIRQNNKNIKDSIEYASNIQEAVLPDHSSIKDLVEDYFVIYEPKDIVSGDLYWFSKAEKNTSQYAFAIMDCTGHGVPGAFMSLIGNTLLNEIVNELGIQSPRQVLRLLEQNIRTALKQDLNTNNDGMDFSICFIKNLEDNKILLRFAGAKQSCYYFDEKGELVVLRGTRRSIGGKNYTNSPAPFEEHEVILPKGTCIYMFTDGFIDQNGRTQRRFGSKRLLEIITANKHLSMARQKEEVLATFNEYRGTADQRDDITLLGIKV